MQRSERAWHAATFDHAVIRGLFAARLECIAAPLFVFVRFIGAEVPRVGGILWTEPNKIASRVFHTWPLPVCLSALIFYRVFEQFGSGVVTLLRVQDACWCRWFISSLTMLQIKPTDSRATSNVICSVFLSACNSVRKQPQTRISLFVASGWEAKLNAHLTKVRRA